MFHSIGRVPEFGLVDLRMFFIANFRSAGQQAQ
jgi:hypothetical protein